MQNIIDETRGKLGKFLNGGETEEKSVGAAAFYGGNGKKLINKIPVQNYEKLDKFAPISWL